MLDQDLIKYINKSLSLGASPDAIKKKLLGAGWKEPDIEAAFSFIEVEKKKIIEEVIKPEDLGGNFPEPVIERIMTVDDYVCDLLRRGKSRDEIFEELQGSFDYDDIKISFDKNLPPEENRMEPSTSLGFIMLALAFISLIIIVWNRLGGEYRVYAISLFTLFYLISGMYTKYQKKIIYGGEMLCLFSSIASVAGVFLASDSFLSSFSWTESIMLSVFMVCGIGLLSNSIMILKFSVTLGLVPAIAYPFNMIKNGESFFLQGFTSSNVFLLIFFITLFWTAMLINKKTND
jgi:hypothetical protein